MSRNTNRRHRRGLRPSTQTAAEAKQGLPRAKKALFGAAAVILVLAVLEGLLSIMGVRPERYEKDPYVGFADRRPLFVEERGVDRRVEMVTARNRLAYFNPQRFPKVKGPGVRRIMCLGGSTTFGRPYDDATSYCGWLRALLAATAPGRWEVINAGGVSYASYRVARVMEELIQYQPNLFVIYAGHNEFLERRIYGRIKHPPPVIRQLHAWSGHLRTTTVMRQMLETLLSRGEGQAAPTILEADVATELENTLGPTTYSRTVLHREETFEHYRFNLGRMVDIARSVGAAVVLITPASNLREVSPFKSERRAEISQEDRRRWLGFYNQAREEYLTNAVPTRALAWLNQAAEIDDLPANLHFVKARVLEKLGRLSEAKMAYERARDEDVCPLRAPGEIGEILRTVAAERRVPLIDFEAMLESRSDGGIPGANVFLDHVHPTIDAHRLLALEILGGMHQNGWLEAVPDAAAVLRVKEKVSQGIDTQAHALALMRLCKVLGWAGKREEAYRAGMQAVRLAPDHASIRYEAGLACRLMGRNEQAVEHYRQAVALRPDYANAHCSLGNALEDLGQLEEAIVHFRLALQFGKPQNAERDQRNLRRALQKAAEAQ